MTDAGGRQLYQRAVAAYAEQRYADALAMFELLPQTPIVAYDAATCKKALGRTKEALDDYGRMLRARVKDPQLREAVTGNFIGCSTMLVKQHADSTRYAEAIELNRKCLELLPSNPVLLYNMGHLYKCTGKRDEALSYLERSIDGNPLYFDAYIEEINIHNDTGRIQKAIEVMYRALEVMPDDARLYNELGVALCRMGKVKEGFDAYQRGIDSPRCDKVCAGKIYTNVGNAYSHIGDIPRSLENSKKAYEVDPTNTTAMQNYLMNMLYLPDVPFTDTLAHHFRVATLFSKATMIKGARPYCSVEGVARNEVIRIGYVGGDFFGEHPMTYFLPPLLTAFDKKRFRVFCYSTSPIGTHPKWDDSIVFRDVKYLSTANACTLIMNDRIDVLVDLAGHTSGNRMDIFANRVARVQLSYLGYPCITGMPEIDYYVIDKTFGFGDRMKTIGMPRCFTCYVPRVIRDPDSLVSAYHRRGGKVSFGTLNKVAKINQKMVDMWDSMLDAFPEARLCLRKQYVFKFRNEARVVYLEHGEKHADHMARYDEIDIAFDTAPYSGTTTTCEAMIMGIPVITVTERKTRTIHQNVSASLLINSGMAYLCVENAEQFKAAVAKTIADIAADPGYRGRVQRKFREGAVMDAAGYVRDFEELVSRLAKP